MDVIQILPEFLEDVSTEEMEELARVAITGYIRALKTAIANSVINARSQVLLDNLEGSTKALAEARKFKAQYNHFLGELNRLNGLDDERSNV